MAVHRQDDNIQEMKAYFTSVIDWITSVFDFVPEREMCGLKWGELYEKYHNKAYDPAAVAAKVRELYENFFVKEKKGIYEYILGGCQEPRLLNVRVFDEPTKKTVYAKQTEAAEAEGISNCPYCAIGHDQNRQRIWKLSEMDADHVTAWSKGGSTAMENCQMLCKTHNRAKGNKYPPTKQTVRMLAGVNPSVHGGVFHKNQIVIWLTSQRKPIFRWRHAR